MGFSPYSTEIRQFKIPPTSLFEQTAKYNVRQYFCLFGILITFFIIKFACTCTTILISPYLSLQSAQDIFVGPYNTYVPL